jgi:hypothetical protein
MYRLYVDEVGTDDMSKTDDEKLRYLSLTGVAMKLDHARDSLTPKMNWIKSHVFDHDIDEPVVFHRYDIVRRKKCFVALHDDEKRRIFDKAIFRIISRSEYRVITAFVDKKALLAKTEWRKNHPYHFLMEILVEKYTQFLERMDDIGDIMPEGRRGKSDSKLQAEFERVRQVGTYYVSAQRMQRRIPSKNLKFRYKIHNVAGLQLSDLLAHPSHIHILSKTNSQTSMGDFCQKIVPILTQHKYDRSNTGDYNGYGVKRFP